jgi:hypothetical protein
VVAPPANRHRSFAGDEAERNNVRVYGARALQDARERARKLWGLISSP